MYFPFNTSEVTFQTLTVSHPVVMVRYQDGKFIIVPGSTTVCDPGVRFTELPRDSSVITPTGSSLTPEKGLKSLISVESFNALYMLLTYSPSLKDNPFS